MKSYINRGLALVGILVLSSTALAYRPAYATNEAAKDVAATAPSSGAPKEISPTQELEKKVESMTEQLKRCAELKEISIRLGCYDEWAEDFGFITPERARNDQQKITRIGLWQVSSKDDGFGNEQFILRTDSLTKVVNKSVERHVSFVIRCVPGKTEAYLDWRAPVLSRGRIGLDFKKMPVMYSVNAEPRVTEDWDVSTDMEALFVPDPIAFVRKIMPKSTLTVSFAPSGSSAETVRFNIEGLDNAVNDIIVKECYGTKAPQTPKMP